MNQHHTAIVHKSAKIGEGVTVGPFSIIGSDVTIGNNTEIAAHVIVENSGIGARCKVGAGSVIGGIPQILNFDKDIPSHVEIGDDNIIAEYVTVHRSGKKEGKTVIGYGNYIMTLVHIGHDCIIENETILTSYAGLSGHVSVADKAMIGGHAGIHQFVKIGSLAMIGGMSRLVKDVPPYFLTEGNPAVARGLNTIGLKRNNIERQAIAELKKAYKLLCRSGLNVSQAVDKIKNKMSQTPEIKNLLTFIENSERGLSL